MSPLPLAPFSFPRKNTSTTKTEPLDCFISKSLEILRYRNWNLAIKSWNLEISNLDISESWNPDLRSRNTASKQWWLWRNCMIFVVLAQIRSFWICSAKWLFRLGTLRRLVGKKRGRRLVFQVSPPLSTKQRTVITHLTRPVELGVCDYGNPKRSS